MFLLQTKDNHKPSNVFNKRFERSVYLKEFKTKIEYKNTANEFTYFLKSSFVGVNRFFSFNLFKPR